MPLGTAVRTRLGGHPATECLRHPHGDDAGRYCNDTVAQYHDHRCHYLAHARLWGDITISDRGQRDDGPVNAARNTGEAVCFTFESRVYYFRIAPMQSIANVIGFEIRIENGTVALLDCEVHIWCPDTVAIGAII